MSNPIQPLVNDAKWIPLVERLVVLIEALAQEKQRQAETIQQTQSRVSGGGCEHNI